MFCVVEIIQAQNRRTNKYIKCMIITLITNKEALTVLCSVVKHAGSARAQKKCFSPLLECSTAS